MPGPLDRLRGHARVHPRVTAAAASSALAAVAAVLARRRGTARPVLPRPEEIGATTAVAVHNAAKGEVIRAVRSADVPLGSIVGDTAREVLSQAIDSGVDVAPAALGVVEGALEIAHLVGESPLSVGQRAAAAALQSAESHSQAAAERVRDVLAPYFEPSPGLSTGPSTSG